MQGKNISQRISYYKKRKQEVEKMGLITKTSGITPKTIMMYKEPSAALSVVVGNATVVADADGKKILKAGSPLYGSLEARATAFVLATTDTTSNAVGVLLHDTDVTEGNANGALLVVGCVNLANLETATAALITAEVKAALAGRIIFAK